MSTGRRAYDLLRGYVNTEWDRIHKVEDDPASQELAESLLKPNLIKSTSLRDADTTGETVAEPGPLAQTPEERCDLARRILGIEAPCGFSEVRRVYERINRRADPSRFPEGSPEARQAAQIQKRVQWAYAVLCDTFDGTEKRFQSLEIE